jgi:Dolichyl-phosphate-mannose-protein mannosyltransferase
MKQRFTKKILLMKKTKIQPTNIKPDKKNDLVSSFSFTKIDNWISVNMRRISLGIVIFSLFLYYNQAVHSPIVFMHNWDQSDMFFYDTWAKEMAQGDWSLNQELHPFASWHKDMADTYFKKYPEKATLYLRATGNDTLKAQKALFNHWYNGKTYHQEPLYAYLVAVTYKLFGENVHWVFIWQMLLGCGINLLIFLLACHYFGNLTGIIAATLVLFCGPIMCYDMVLLRSTLTVFLSLILLCFFEKAREKETPQYFLLFGVFSGLSYINQSYTILFIGACITLFLYEKRRKIASFLPFLKYYVVGLALILSLPIIRNITVGAPAMSIASNGGLTYIMANEKGINPYVALDLEMNNTTSIMDKTEGKMLPSMIESIASHNNFFSFLGLISQKIRATFYGFEMPNNMNYYHYQSCAPVLKFMFMDYFILAPLAIVGLILVFFDKSRKPFLPVLMLFLSGLVPLLFVTAIARYRVNLMAISIPFAAYTLMILFKSIKEKSYSLSAKVAVGLFFTALLTINARYENIMPYQLMDYDMGIRFYYQKELKAANDAKDWQRCTVLLEDIIEHQPPFISEIIEGNRQIENEEEAKLAKHYYPYYRVYATTLMRLGKEQEAQDVLIKANKISRN